eukprot:scaffold2851_cov104-Cylindrotheca_fusiformis.AAC.1
MMWMAVGSLLSFGLPNFFAEASFWPRRLRRAVEKEYRRRHQPPPPAYAYQSHAPYRHRARLPPPEGETRGTCEWKWNKKKKKGNRHHGPYYVDRHGRCHQYPSPRPNRKIHFRSKPQRKFVDGWKAAKRQDRQDRQERRALSKATNWEWDFMKPPVQDLRKTPGVEDWNWTPQKRTLYIPKPVTSNWCVPTGDFVPIRNVDDDVSDVSSNPRVVNLSQSAFDV